MCIKAMNDACNELLQGQITLDVLKILLSGKQNFISIVEEINAFATEFIETTLCIREKELEAFTTTLAYVKEFVYVCRKIEGILLPKKMKQNFAKIILFLKFCYTS